MALTIGPVVHGAGILAKGLGVYVFLSTAAAASVGATLGALGLALGQGIGEVALLTIAGAYAAVYLFRSRLLEIQVGPQMPRHWINLTHPIRTVAHFALVLGSTYATPIRAGTVLALGAIAWALGSPLGGAVLFGVMATTRNLPVLWFALGGRDPASKLERLVGYRGLLLMADAALLSALFVRSAIEVVFQSSATMT